MKVEWLGPDQKVDSDTLANLLTYHQNAEWNAIKVYATHKNILFTGLMALLGLGAYASVGNKTELLFASLLFPFFALALRRFSIETLDRYYRRILEAIVVTAKLEYLSGLHKRVNSDNVSGNADEHPLAPFPSDKYLDVHRRWESRATTKAKNSGYWIVDFMGRGHNLVAWDFFRTISVLACLLPCLALAGQRLRNDTRFSDYFLIATVVVLILTTLVYRSDSRTIWKQRVKTSLPDRDSEWDAIVQRKMQGQDAQVPQTANKSTGGDVQ